MKCGEKCVKWLTIYAKYGIINLNISSHSKVLCEVYLSWRWVTIKSNFEFLSKYWDTLAKIVRNAESYLYNDPNACIYKLGMFAERLVQEIFANERLTEPDYDNTHANRIKILKREGLIDRGGIIDDILYSLRIKRNDAVHKYEDSVDTAKSLLSIA